MVGCHLGVKAKIRSCKQRSAVYALHKGSFPQKRGMEHSLLFIFSRLKSKRTLGKKQINKTKNTPFHVRSGNKP